jgi:hypothetical protein
VREALRRAGVKCSLEDVEIIARNGRWAVPFPGQRIVIEGYEAAGSARMIGSWFTAISEGTTSQSIGNPIRSNGIFDFDGVVWADRYHDFRYLLLTSIAKTCGMQPLRSTSTRRSNDRSRAYPALQCGLRFLAFSAAISADQKSGGRTKIFGCVRLSRNEVAK